MTTVVDSVNAEVASEIARTIDYFKSTMPDADVQQVLLCGGGAQVKGLVTQLRDRMQAVVEVANPFGEIDTSGTGFRSGYVSRIGSTGCRGRWIGP